MAGGKSKLNGIDAEQKAKEILPKLFDGVKVSFINALIDFYLNGQYVEVKSCDQWITDNSHTTGRRRGRFVFTKAQHEFLLRNNGFYLFIVRCTAGKSYFRLYKAEDIKLEFGNSNIKCISWKKIWDGDFSDE